MRAPTNPARNQARAAFNVCLLVASVALPAASAQEPALDPQLVPDSMLSVPEGFEVTIWAQSPQLRNPTNMDIDAKGRIWVAEGVNYRWHEGRAPAGDRIIVLEDLNADGMADTSHVFVQEPDLIAPLGIAVVDNRIFVSNAPDLIVYTDVDRDLRFDPRVDKREVLLTGFNGRNHDHSLHSVTFGPDGRLYLNHGNSGALVTDRSGRTFRVGSAYDGLLSNETVPLYGILPIEYAGSESDDGHVYVGGFAMRMEPDGTNLEVIGFNFRNSYEQTVTSFGDVFQNDNDDPPACRTTFLMEYGNAGWFSRDGSRFWRADRRPGQSIPTSQWRQDDPGVIPAGDVYGAGAPTGIVFYEGDALGKDWRGTLLSCESARNTVFGYRPAADGAGYDLERFHFLTSNVEEELAGTDMLQGKVSEDLKTFFRPSDVAVGPDGAIYVADWFDARVGGHQDLDEHTAGTIYRIAPIGFKPAVPNFNLDTVDGQIEALKNPATNVRALGFVPLRAAGAASIPPVAALLKDENPYIRARAVWLLAQLGPGGIKKVEGVLRSDDPQLRATAFEALRRVDHRILEHAAKLARDPSPIVRREVAVAMRDVPFEKSRKILLELAAGYDGIDRAYLEAWGIGCSGKEAQVYAALAAQGGKDALKWSRPHAGLVWRLTPEAAVEAFARRAASSELDQADRMAAVTALGFIPTHDAAAALLELADSGEGNVKRHALWWLLNYRNTRWSGAGIDEALKASGIYDPETVVVAPSVVPEAMPEAMLSAAKISGLEGNVARGAEKVTACYLCHQVGGNGTEYGPDLTGWAGRQGREVTIGAIVNPSSDIAHGFEGRMIALNDRTIVHGIVESEGDPLVVRSMGGIVQMIPADRVASVHRLSRSLMLSADQLGLTEQDVADIVAFLQSN